MSPNLLGSQRSENGHQRRLIRPNLPPWAQGGVSPQGWALKAARTAVRSGWGAWRLRGKPLRVHPGRWPQVARLLGQLAITGAELGR